MPVRDNEPRSRCRCGSQPLANVLVLPHSEPGGRCLLGDQLRDVEVCSERPSWSGFEVDRPAEPAVLEPLWHGQRLDGMLNDAEGVLLSAGLVEGDHDVGEDVRGRLRSVGGQGTYLETEAPIIGGCPEQLRDACLVVFVKAKRLYARASSLV